MLRRDLTIRHNLSTKCIIYSKFASHYKNQLIAVVTARHDHISNVLYSLIIETKLLPFIRLCLFTDTLRKTYLILRLLK